MKHKVLVLFCLFEHSLQQMMLLYKQSAEIFIHIKLTKFLVLRRIELFTKELFFFTFYLFYYLENWVCMN
jgi:hypothetical protein